MSRKRKFRVWDKLAERFIYSSDPGQQHYILNLKGEFYNLQNGSGGEEYIVQDCIGVFDKNGREIYEGDIVHYLFDGDSYPKEATNVNLCCVYEEKNGWFAFKEKQDDREEYLWYEIRNHATVIGNIFETPHLLE